MPVKAKSFNIFEQFKGSKSVSSVRSNYFSEDYQFQGSLAFEQYLQTQQIKSKIERQMLRHQRMKKKTNKSSNHSAKILALILVLILLLMQISYILNESILNFLAFDHSLIFMIQVVVILMLCIFLQKNEIDGINKKIRQLEKKYRLIQRHQLLLENQINS